MLLSIRRESLFIAVLGLLGGFATPALLSTGENRPIPLFAYLLLLNVGLAWVAYQQVWPSLTVLTLVLTTIYQWGWVATLPDRERSAAGAGHLRLFPVVAMSALLVRPPRAAPRGSTTRTTAFEQSTAGERGVAAGVRRLPRRGAGIRRRIRRCCSDSCC